MILMVLLEALYSSAIPISKYLLRFTSPIFLAGLRMAVAGALLLIFKFATKREQFLKIKNDLAAYGLIIFFGVYIKYVLRYWALSQMSGAKMAFLWNITPFVAALMSYFTFHERLSFKQWIGLSIGFVGFIPVLLTTSSSEKLFGELMFISWPELAIVAAIISHSIGLIIARKLIRNKKHSSSLTNGIRMFGGGILALGTSFLMEGTPHISHVSTFSTWFMILIVLSNIICHNLNLMLLKKYSVTFLSFAEFLCPFFVALFGWLFLGEVITWHFYMSAVIVFVGLYLFYYDELQQTQLEAQTA